MTNSDDREKLPKEESFGIEALVNVAKHIEGIFNEINNTPLALIQFPLSNRKRVDTGLYENTEVDITYLDNLCQLIEFSLRLEKFDIQTLNWETLTYLGSQIGFIYRNEHWIFAIRFLIKYMEFELSDEMYITLGENPNMTHRTDEFEYSPNQIKFRNGKLEITLPAFNVWNSPIINNSVAQHSLTLIFDLQSRNIDDVIQGTYNANRLPFSTGLSLKAVK